LIVDFALVIAAAAIASGLTMFSGFGLGTVLLPVFALFLPVELAVAATALVHGANNVLKTALLGKGADRSIVLRFGLPAIVAAFGGAYLLAALSGMPATLTHSLFGREAVVTPLKLAMAVLMAGFAIVELHPRFAKLEFDRRMLPLGGLLSGFFGGLSGHQGALRSAFLAKAGLTTSAFVGTNAVIGLMVDLVRIGTYGAVLLGGSLGALAHSREGSLVLTGTLAAFTGVIIGARLLHKVTMPAVQRLTGVMLLVIAVLLGLGLV
jgi:uncharacterized membrane protein YfcA